MQACVVLILIGYKKQKGKRHLKKRRKKQIILYYCLSLISDTTLSYSLLGLAPGTGPTPFLFDYTLSLRDAPDILMLFLRSVQYHHHTQQAEASRSSKVNHHLLGEKMEARGARFVFLVFFALWEELGLNITGWTEHTGRRREYRGTESSRLLSFPLLF